MFEKLSFIEERYNELSKQISDPEVISDQALFAKLCKEQSDIAPIVEKYKEYQALKEAIEESEEILADPEMDKEFKNFKPTKAKKSGLFKKDTESTNSISSWIKQKEASCFICSSVDKTFQAYMKTFFTMYKKDASFREQVANTKGFCLSHFSVLCDAADTYLNEKEL